MFCFLLSGGCLLILAISFETYFCSLCLYLFGLLRLRFLFLFNFEDTRPNTAVCLCMFPFSNKITIYFISFSYRLPPRCRKWCSSAYCWTSSALQSFCRCFQPSWNTTLEMTAVDSTPPCSLGLSPSRRLSEFHQNSTLCCSEVMWLFFFLRFSFIFLFKVFHFFCYCDDERI